METPTQTHPHVLFFLETPTQIIPENTTHLILSKTYDYPFSLTQLPKTITYLDLGWEFNSPTNFKLLFPHLKTLIFSLFYMHEISEATLPVSLDNIVLGNRNMNLIWKEKVYHLNRNDCFFKTAHTSPNTKHIILDEQYKETHDKWKSAIWNMNLDDYAVEYVRMIDYWQKKNLVYMLVEKEKMPELLYKIAINSAI